MMKELQPLMKSVEIELRSNGKLSEITHSKLTELTDWQFRIMEGFMVEVNLAMSRKDPNYVFKKYDVDQHLKARTPRLDLLICLTKRNQHDLVLTDVVNRLMPAFKYPNVKWDTMEVWGMPIERARNFCIEKALERGAKKVLFIDDDMIIENTALNRLWDVQETTGAICVAGEYQKKAAYEITAHGNKIAEADEDGKPSGYYSTDLCAMGFTLIDLQKLTAKVPAPYFWVFLAPDGLWSMGEDAFFTKNLIEHAGEYPLICTDVSILHYDKHWKKCFGKRNKDITYATEDINNFTTFDHIRVPPAHPLISIAIPGRTESDPVCTDLNRLVLDRGYKSTLLRVFGKNVDQARNELASQSVLNDSRYVLFIDDDIVMPRDAVSRMIEIMEKDEDEQIGAVTGDYLLKGIPAHSVHLQLDKEGIVTELSKLDTPTRVEANWLIGMGCCLVRTSVFRQIQWPWFLCHNLKENDAAQGGVNEDAHFTEMLLNNGYKIIIARDIKCMHLDTKTGVAYTFEKEVNLENYAYPPFINQFQVYSLEDYEATKT